MTYLRFLAARQGGEERRGMPAWIALIREANGEMPGLFGRPEHVEEAEGTREVYPEADVKHAVTDHHWIYVIPKTPAAKAAILAAARALNLPTRPLERDT
jgi:hypothetical protein